MKKLMILLAVTMVTLVSCKKEVIEPASESATSLTNCDTTAIYNVDFTIDNPDNTFVVFLNNVQVSGNFSANSGDILTWSMEQNCDYSDNPCQWSVGVHRNGEFLYGSASNASTANHTYYIPQLE